MMRSFETCTASLPELAKGRPANAANGAGVARLDPSRAGVLEGREVQEGLRFVVARQPS